MSASGELRQDARRCLERARGLLELRESAATRYACLELRQAIEYLAYQLLDAYLDEVPDDAMRKWKPREVIAQMREVDPKADKTSTIRYGMEEVRGEPEVMKTLGEDRRLTLKWANSAHNALSNFLHAPTLHQMDTGGVADENKMRSKAEEVAGAVEHTLATGIYNVNLGNFYNIDCACGRKFKRRAGSFEPEQGIVCPNTGCRAIWDVVLENDSTVTIRQRQEQYVCEQCKKTNYVDSQRLSPGVVIRCDCGARSEASLGLFPLEE